MMAAVGRWRSRCLVMRRLHKWQQATTVQVASEEQQIAARTKLNALTTSIQDINAKLMSLNDQISHQKLEMKDVSKKLETTEKSIRDVEAKASESKKRPKDSARNAETKRKIAMLES